MSLAGPAATVRSKISGSVAETLNGNLTAGTGWPKSSPGIAFTRGGCSAKLTSKVRGTPGEPQPSLSAILALLVSGVSLTTLMESLVRIIELGELLCTVNSTQLVCLQP